MAAQVTAKLQRSQTQRLSKGISASPPVSKQAPKTAVSRSQAPALRTSTRLHTSYLPVPAPAVNKATKVKNKNKNKAEANDLPPSSTSERTSKQPPVKDSLHISKGKPIISSESQSGIQTTQLEANPDKATAGVPSGISVIPSDEIHPSNPPNETLTDQMANDKKHQSPTPGQSDNSALEGQGNGPEVNVPGSAPEGQGNVPEVNPPGSLLPPSNMKTLPTHGT